jgi:hypothetical protein
MIKAWSMSRLDVYETCPYRAYLQYVERIPTPELVPPPDKTEHPLTRGLRVHTAAEEYVTQDINLIPELQSFSADFDLQRASYRFAPELCIIEQEWAFDDDWRATGWFSDDTWGRLKLDYGEVKGDEIDIVDYKTGKKYPPKHIQQGQLYALVAGLRYPDVKKFNVAFWYTDSGDTLTQSYSKVQTLMFKEMFDMRARTMTTATEFRPHSSAYACRFCPYGEGRDGNKHCEYRYSFDN